MRWTAGWIGGRARTRTWVNLQRTYGSMTAAAWSPISPCFKRRSGRGRTASSLGFVRPVFHGTANYRENRADESERRSGPADRKSTRLNSSHVAISYAVFCLKKKKAKKKNNLMHYLN